MPTRSTSSKGNKQIKMELKIFRKHSTTTIIIFFGFFLLLCQPLSIDGLCTLQRNGAHAHCHSLDDIKYIDTYGLKGLRVSSVGKYLAPETFGSLTSLKHLNLSNGVLTTIEPNSFHNFHNLHSLDLSNNHLTHLIPGALNDLKFLRLLNLSRNFFTEIPSDIEHLEHLKHLDLSRNNIKCDCKTLRLRDKLIENGVAISQKTACSGLHNLDGKKFSEPEADAVCMFDEQDMDMGMQGDQPMDDKLDGSGEGSGDPFDDIKPEDIPEDDEKPTEHTSDIHDTTSAMPIEIPLTPDTTTSSDDELFFTEETDKHLTISPTSESTEASTSSTTAVVVESEKPKVNEWGNEGSGDDDAEDPWVAEGSGFEGSGIGIVPPINWDNVESEGTDKNGSNEEETSQRPTSSTTTETEGIIDTIYGFFWGTNATPVKVTPANDLNLEEEQFIPAISSTSKPEVHDEAEEKIIPPPILKSNVEQNPDSVKASVVDNSRSGKVLAEIPIDNTESPDASTAEQSKKGMGSYVVLGVLLGVLGALIGFAAYKGDFCKPGRKRNDDRNRSIPDLETGTELKDLTKSLLENPNSVQPKISSSNGGKLETIPLVTSSGIPTEIKNDDEPTSKFTGSLANESVDPVKPPRKSFSPNELENGKKNGTNGKIITTPELTSGQHEDNELPVVCPIPMARDSLVNGKNDRDSLSSIGGDSPSSGSHSARLSNPRLSQGLPPASPHAQRVKITLQDNPDSVPKTPLLITRTKAGENLFKTP